MFGRLLTHPLLLHVIDGAPGLVEDGAFGGSPLLPALHEGKGMIFH
jgi:hypothetical protein